MQNQFGFPVVSADNVFDVLAERNIRPWAQTNPVISLADYLQQPLSEPQRSELRFAPKTEVVSLTDHHGNPFRGFRTAGKNWTTVFTLLPGNLLPIVGEYKHGVDEVVLVPPSGVPHKEDLQTPNPWTTCAQREWEEETGLKLRNVEPLSDHPLIISGRQCTMRYYPLLGPPSRTNHQRPIEAG